MSRTLWPHQEKALVMLGNEFRQGHKAVVVVMPTGAGKTALAAALTERHLTKVPSGRVLFIAHRDELIGQTYDSFTLIGMECAVIQAKPCRRVNPFVPVQIASTQTLLARSTVVEGVSMLIADECHHYMSDKWIEILETYKKLGAFIIGLTATPVRGDGRGLGG